MGLQETIAKFMMKFFKPNPSWEDNVTAYQLDELEKQGCDVTELRAKLKAKEEAEQVAKEARLAAFKLEKLAPHIATPRAADSQFVLDVVKLNGLSSKESRKLLDAPIVYGAVVQAHSALWEPGDAGRTGIVFVFALDEAHIHDTDWLNATAKKISELKEQGNVPKDCEEFIKTLRDDQSYFCFKLGESISDGANAWCVTFALYDQRVLPASRLPEGRILPMLLLDPPVVNQFAELELIPSEYFYEA